MAARKKKSPAPATGDESVTYWSLDEYADAAEVRQVKTAARDRGEWAGGVTWDGALDLARRGWAGQLDAALDLAQTAVETAEQEHVINDVFTPVWDVTGTEVDVARYLSGEPECMISFPLTPTSTSGRVITMCASVSYSGSIEADTIQRRGKNIVALALALSRLGHNTELWADFSGVHVGNGDTVRIRVLVKGPNDELDPSRVMFAYAHPAMLRVLGLGVLEGWGDKFPSNGTAPVPPARDLPEGTTYLPELRSSSDVPDADRFLREHLAQLGLLAE